MPAIVSAEPRPPRWCRPFPLACRDGKAASGAQLRKSVNPHASAPSPPPEFDASRWFREEVQPHERALRAYLHRRYPTLSDVDDFVQESFLKAYQARRGGTLISIRGFLFRVAGNAVVSFFRKRQRLVPQALDELSEREAPASESDVVAAVCDRDEIELMSEAIARLPERCRQVIMLRLFHGQGYPEISAQLGMSEATVRVQVARGMRKCAAFLREKGLGGAVV